MENEKSELQRIAEATERTAKNTAFLTYIVIASLTASFLIIVFGKILFRML